MKAEEHGKGGGCGFENASGKAEGRYSIALLFLSNFSPLLYCTHVLQLKSELLNFVLIQGILPFKTVFPQKSLFMF